MLTTVFKKLFGTHNDRQMKSFYPLVQKVNQLEPEIQKLTDEQLKAKTTEFRQRFQGGESLDSMLPEAFAVCREAAIRVLGMRHYDVQLIGGIVIHKGSIAEMKTGEGKTLVATLPVYLNAISGKGVHVVTVNDYLASRDSDWMGKLYRWLGLSVGLIVNNMDDQKRKENYNCDITYGTNNEFGFDYLRDNMKYSLKDYVQREHNFAIVDECDSVLVDEARTPLIISGPAEDNIEKYSVINKVVPHLKKDVHFIMEEKTKTASLTEEGNAKVEEILGVENVYDPKHIDILHHIYNGLKAYHLYRLDVDYMIIDGEIVIVDEFTGRPMPGRRWSDGLHQAIEAKEGVPIKRENQTLASITFQNYFRMYNKLSGMTGTADTEAVEFKKIYNLEVFVIPTNKPIARLDRNDVIYKNEPAKIRAIVEDIRERSKKGQPVLVGTVSIEKSEEIGQALNKYGIRNKVLNAKYHDKEAEIVAQAGRKGAITIATNMAGRGTDIVLGGNPEFMAKAEVDDETSAEFESAFSRYKSQCDAEKKQVIEAGGLCIIGTERHESRRIDNQLRGRSGRQGDPGESRFYLSLDDNLLRIFQGDRIKAIMDRLNFDENEPIDHKMITRSVEGAQKKVEGHNFDIRKHLLEYDDVMNQQRNTIYVLRRDILEGKEIDEIVREMLGDVTSTYLDTYAHPDASKESWNLDALQNVLEKNFGVSVDFSSINSSHDIDDAVMAAIKTQYDQQKNQLDHMFDEVRQMVLLRVIDTKWKEHLRNMDHLKEGINLRSFAQKDPLIEYKKEAFKMFSELDFSIKQDALEQIFKIQLVVHDDKGNAIPVNQLTKQDIQDEFEFADDDGDYELNDPSVSLGGSPFMTPPERQMSYSNQGPEPDRTPFVRDDDKVGRNDPCPCGSGKKYKKCHGKS